MSAFAANHAELSDSLGSEAVADSPSTEDHYRCIAVVPGTRSNVSNGSKRPSRVRQGALV